MSVSVLTPQARAQAHPRRSAARLPVTLGVVGAALSLAWSWEPSYWSDEVATVRAASLTVPQLFSFVQHKDAVHALYYLLMHAWSLIAGSSELALRAPSAVAVGIATAGVAVIGRILRGRLLGIVSGVVFAILPRTTYMGAEARSYGMTAVLAVALTLVVLVVLQAPHSRPRLFVLFGVLVALSLLLFVYLAFFVAALAIVVLLTRPARRTLVGLSIATGGAIVVTFPWLVVIASQKGQIAWLGDQPVLNAWTVLAEPWFDASVAAVFVGWALLIVGGVRWRRIRGDAPSLPLAVALPVAWVVVPTLLLLLLNIPFGPLYTSRYLSFCEPGFALLLALVITSFDHRVVVWGLVAALAIASAPTYVAQRGPYAKNGGSDLRQLADVVQQHAHPGDAIVFEKLAGRTKALDPRLAIDAYPAKFAGLRDVALVQAFPATGSFSDRTASLQAILPRLNLSKRVWYVTSTLTRDCATLPSAAPLLGAGWRATTSYPLFRNTVCEFAR